ncbi:MAG: LysR substrate-binding domain-containing protein [Paracoccaceae bacterium]|nr:LysR substrate-binding domain-containing protein [Paracoccaceae bacterium]
MNWSALPPLSALRAFAAYVDTGSVTAAGTALNVSHAAISQQMRALEAHLGLALLDRSGRALQLTAEGEALARSLTGAFQDMILTIEALTGADASRPLHISCTPSFAASWLMPRLASFRAENPTVDLMINPTPQRADPSPGGIDLAIRYGTGPWPGLDTQPLMPAPLAVVAAPSLFDGPPPTDPAEFVRYPWLQELGSSETTQWLADHGVLEPRPGSVTHVPGNLMIDGARNGQGLAVSTLLAVAEDVATGRLVILFQDDGPEAYHIVTHPSAMRPQLKAFLRWLRREAQKT